MKRHLIITFLFLLVGLSPVVGQGDYNDLMESFGNPPAKRTEPTKSKPEFSKPPVLPVSQIPATDIYEGLSRHIPYRYMIPPYGLEVTIEKTTHIIFPTSIKYVDLGNENIMASVTEDASNVLRVKAAELFTTETNMSVITDNGNFYTFNVKFAQEPEKLAIEMQNFLSDGDSYNRPNNSLDIYLKELQSENPKMIHLIMQTIHDNNMRFIKHIGAQGFGVQYLLKGIYSYAGMLYFFTEARNSSNVDYNLDYLTFKIVDKQVIKRTTIQEVVLKPVRAYNYVTTVGARKTELTVLAFPIFTIPNDKILQFDMHEKNGGRHQIFEVDNTDLVRAKEIKDFSITINYNK